MYINATTRFVRSNDAWHTVFASFYLFELQLLPENPLRFRDRAENVIK
jgi:hypothetical protein